MKYGLAAIVILLVGSLLTAQDPHFSQPLEVRSWYSPAMHYHNLDGYRFHGGIRDQWRSVPVPFTSALFSGGGTFEAAGDKLHWQAMFMYDEAGDARLRWMQLRGSVSRLFAIGPSLHLKGGVSLGLFQRSFDPQHLTFNAQYNGQFHDPSMPSGEQFDRQSRLGVDLSLGTGLYWKLSEQLSLDIIYGAHHLNRPAVNFFDDEKVRLPMRHALMADLVMAISKRLTGNFFHLEHSQGPGMYNFREHISGAGIKWAMLQSRAKDVHLLGGVAYRYGDAIIPSAGLAFNHWTAKLSYDINTSAFATATRSRGGIEFHLTRTFHRKPNYDLPPACPAL